MGLTREQILEADLVVKEVETPEWGGDGVTYVRMIPLKERFALSDKDTESEERVVVGNFIIRYCLSAICDEKGKRLFLDEDEDKLREKESNVILRIYEVAKELNGENIEDLAKNSEKTQSKDSASD